MDTPTLVPVTEAEMTGFFQRVTTSFVALSRQAAELEEVKHQLDSMNARMAQLISDNGTLKSERDDAIMNQLETETKLNDARRHRDSLEHQVSSLNEAIIGRDSKVSELNGLLTSAKLEAEDWQRKHDYQERVANDLRNQLQTVRERRDHFRDRAEAAEQELTETKAKLTKVIEQMTTMSDILGIVKQAQEVPAAPANPTSTNTDHQSSAGGQEVSQGSETPKAPKPWWEQPKDDMPF
jgi:chromosome segregation ATPase